ncbi:TonB-dependent receptor plug domain-containing protein [Pseudoduganella armeniaca]|uniref:TonB-dependent receptor n=1 Tax=Pseudoduganella armeniaca TaxID=2072590 RepID=A0A2R4C7S7_9BURK|nr:TonB-dependent receptor [Pseudoduganella armeniaca]AVR95646.1 TonB-dependent receptor [Pseudoduganella armeniaca]
MRALPLLLLTPTFLLPLCGAAEEPHRVVVAGPGGNAQRQNDTAGKVVVARDELLQYGDGGLAGALARVPGLTVGADGVRMRGLAAGYTQILVNGDPVPPGFSLDTLAPELVERIEILRTTAAEYSAQAMAGTINIVLRKAVRGAQRDAKLALAREQDAWSPALTAQLADKDEHRSWLVAATLARARSASTPLVATRDVKPDGSLLAQRRFDETYQGHANKASVAPRVTWTMASGDTLAWQGLLDVTRSANAGTSRETTLAGPATRSPLARFNASADETVVRGDVTWTHRLDAAQLTAKASANSNRREGDYLFRGSDRSLAPTLTRHVTSTVRDDSIGSSGKLLVPLWPGHGVAIGWDGSRTRRAETRLQHDTVPAETVLDQAYDASVTRMAWYAQDEWDIGPRWQAYLGLRWEGLDTAIDGRGLARSGTRASVWSPVANVLWKVPERGQWRLALARTYKAPLTRNLVPRRYTVNNDNAPATPDVEGNPALRPELAWGVDAGWETYFTGKGVISASAYARRISDVTVQRLFRDGDTWVSTLANGGNAKAHGIELDARLPLAPFVKAAPDLELRLNASRNWSRVAAVPGPFNRLAEQTPLTANAGLDYRWRDGWSAGLNYRYQGGATSRATALLSGAVGPTRALDTYLAWHGGQRGKLRIGLANLLQREAREARWYEGAEGASERLTVTPSARALRVQFDYPLAR